MNEARAIQLEALAARLDRTGTWAWLISTSRIPAMDGIRRIKVREAQHMGRVRSGAQSLVEVIDGRPDNRHKASMDVVFCSVAKHADHNALGIIMTGMGDDGACGLLAMSEPGAAQSPRMKPAVV